MALPFHPSKKQNMKKLKLVKKLDQHGCSIACLAMVTGKSYFEVRDAIHKNVPRLKNVWPEPNRIGLYGPEIVNFLESAFGISSKFIKFSSLLALKKHCILLICSLTGDLAWSHAIVFDAKIRRIIDPDNTILDLKRYNVFCCMEIQ